VFSKIVASLGQGIEKPSMSDLSLLRAGGSNRPSTPFGSADSAHHGDRDFNIKGTPFFHAAFNFYHSFMDIDNLFAYG
jgi:hypothetical protein